MYSAKRINDAFSHKKAYIAYLTAGDGGIEHTFIAACALIDAGISLLEIGVPFSDPIADGPVIQRAATRSLEHGTTLEDIVILVKKIRHYSEIPIILFSYFNPILATLGSSFLLDAKNAGVDGLLLVDCPLEEMKIINLTLNKVGIIPIYVVTPTTPLSRIKKISQQAQGFLYYACRKGTTGLRNSLPENFPEKIISIKTVSALPIAVGFGVSHPDMSKRILQYADGVVVGSLFVKAIEEGASSSELTILAKNIFNITE